MWITKNELTNFVTEALSRNNQMKILAPVIESMNKRWFSVRDATEIQLDDLNEWLCEINDNIESEEEDEIQEEENAKRLPIFGCLVCGNAVEGENMLMFSKLEVGAGKVVRWNEEKQDFELVPKIYEKIGTICPFCNSATVRYERVINDM